MTVRTKRSDSIAARVAPSRSSTQILCVITLSGLLMACVTEPSSRSEIIKLTRDTPVIMPVLPAQGLLDKESIPPSIGRVAVTDLHPATPQHLRPEFERWLVPDDDSQDPPPGGPEPRPGDTDGDGYLDEDERLAGTDPNDPESRIYTGGWPFNRDKASLEETAWEENFELGRQLPNFRMQDQFGEWVELYDMAGHGTPIIITLGSLSCWPCSDLAGFLSDGDVDAHLRIRSGVRAGEYLDWWGEEYAVIYDLIRSGDLIWLTVLSDNHYNEEDDPIDAANCAGWAERFPNPKIPVLADARSELRHFVGSGGVSLVPILLDENFVVQRFHTTTVFRFLLSEEGPFPQDP